MEASGSGEHEDKRLKLSFLEEMQIENYPHRASAIEASDSEEHEDKRWSLKEEIPEVLFHSVELSFLEEEIKLFESTEGLPQAIEASGSEEHEDERWSLKEEIPEVLSHSVELRSPEEEIKLFESTEGLPQAIEASGSEEHEDKSKRWSLKEEISEVLYRSVELSFPEEEIELFESTEGHDFEWPIVLTIWSKLRKNPELRKLKYSDIEVPKHFGEVIMNSFLEVAGDRIQKSSVHDVGIVGFSLSRRWLAKSIHKMLKDGIDTWAPKLPVGIVLVGFPLLEDKINLGWFRQHVIADALIRMLQYSKVEVWSNPDKHELTSLLIPQLQRKWGKSIQTKEKDGDAVIYVENKPPFILAREDTGTSDRDLETLWFGIHEKKADWIVYLTPVRQQEYIEMCFTAAKLEGWIKYVEGKWNPGLVPEYPVLTYAGYRTYSTVGLSNLAQQIFDRCDLVALAEDAQLLEYDDEAVVGCVLIYTCLKNHRLADCTFNSDEMVQKEGNTFVYLLHRRAEVNRITDYFSEDIKELKKQASDLILDKYEGWEEGEVSMLIFHLLMFNEVVEESSLFVLPHVMCEYLYDLSKKFMSYNNSVLRTGSVAETRRLLLCEATAVVMDKCFHLLGITPKALNLRLIEEALARGADVEVGVEPQKMAEREQMDRTRLDPDFVDQFITPCFVSHARDPSRNSRFELMSIIPEMTTDATLNGFLFGQIAVSDKYGSVPDVGYPYYEPDFSYVSLFRHEWCDPVNLDMRHAGLVFPDNPSSHQVPFSSSIVIHAELYASTEKKDDCFQLCNEDIILDLKNIWSENKVGVCRSRTLVGLDGTTIINYVLLKDAVDAALEVSFVMDTDREVYGDVFAYYEDGFHYGENALGYDFYKASLYSSYPSRPGLIETPTLKSSGPIPLKRCMVAVPKNGSLTIQAHFLDPQTEDTIFSKYHNFKTPTGEDSRKGSATLEGRGCRLKLTVVWKC